MGARLPLDCRQGNASSSILSSGCAWTLTRDYLTCRKKSKSSHPSHSTSKSSSSLSGVEHLPPAPGTSLLRRRLTLPLERRVAPLRILLPSFLSAFLGFCFPPVPLSFCLSLFADVWFLWGLFLSTKWFADVWASFFLWSSSHVYLAPRNVVQKMDVSAFLYLSRWHLPPCNHFSPLPSLLLFSGEKELVSRAENAKWQGDEGNENAEAFSAVLAAFRVSSRTHRCSERWATV